MSASEETRRTWIALGLAEVLFAVTYPVCAWLALAVPSTDTRDGWADLALFAMLLVVGVFAVLVGLPIGVHTVGRLTARWVQGRSSLYASSAHLIVGLGMGTAVAVTMIRLAQVEPAAAVIVFAVPLGVVGVGTNLLMPLAVNHAWVRIAAWVLGAMPVVVAVSLLASWGMRSAN